MPSRLHHTIRMEPGGRSHVFSAQNHGFDADPWRKDYAPEPCSLVGFWHCRWRVDRSMSSEHGAGDRDRPCSGADRQHLGPDPRRNALSDMVGIPLLRFAARIIFATFMTLAAGLLVGAFLLRALLFYPEAPTPSEPEGIRVLER